MIKVILLFIQSKVVKPMGAVPIPRFSVAAHQPEMIHDVDDVGACWQAQASLARRFSSSVGLVAHV